MAFKDVIVQTDATPSGLARLRIAARIAALEGGYLTGLYIRSPREPLTDLPLFTNLGLQTGMGATSLQQIAVDEERASRQREEALQKESACARTEDTFREELARQKIEGAWLSLDATSLDLIATETRYADLIVVGQPLAHNYRQSADAAFDTERAVSSGRPVLIIPNASNVEVPGKRVLIAWNGSCEAVRAVSDAMPFLEHADFVAIVAVDPPWRDPEDGMCTLAKLAVHLKRHGIDTERYIERAPQHAAGEHIVARAEHACCDLIVMGAYGHSPTQEILFGGATRTILKKMKTAVMMSH